MKNRIIYSSFLVIIFLIIPLNQNIIFRISDYQINSFAFVCNRISYLEMNIERNRKIFTIIEHEPIYINTNIEFFEHALREGWNGNGTAINPFLIEGYNLTNRNDLVLITNSDVHFQISNCVLNGEGSGIGIAFTNVSNGRIINNIIYGNEIGIIIGVSSENNTILKNQVSNNTQVGIHFEEGSRINVVKMNDITNMNITTQAIDNGFYNTFVFNFWGQWNNPDSNTDGIVDIPYPVSGTSNNTDPYPLSTMNPPKEHILSKPRIINPVAKENLKGTVLIEWTESIDSYENIVFYTVDFSNDNRIWKPLASDLQVTMYSLNTEIFGDGSNFWIRIRSSCFESEITNDVFFGPFSIQNLFTPFIRFAFTIFLLMLTVSILFGAIFWRKRVSSKEKTTINHSELRNLKLSISYGSFTDDGLVIRGKSKSCTFDIHQLQSMLEYSAMLYQYGKIGEMYGPFPLRKGEGNISKDKWYYVTVWIKMKDETIEDLRITKRQGEVPTGILLFFPKQFESIILSYKQKICDIFATMLRKLPEVSDITSNVLNEIEAQIYNLFSS